MWGEWREEYMCPNSCCVGVCGSRTRGIGWDGTQLIKALEAARGNGTSMISLIMPPRDQVSSPSVPCPTLSPAQSDEERSEVWGWHAARQGGPPSATISSSSTLYTARSDLTRHHEGHTRVSARDENEPAASAVHPSPAYAGLGARIFHRTLLTVQGLAVQVARVTKMLGDEFGTASNIKNRVNRQSVLGAITSAQQRLKLYNRVPPVRVPLSPPCMLSDAPHQAELGDSHSSWVPAAPPVDRPPSVALTLTVTTLRALQLRQTETRV